MPQNHFIIFHHHLSLRYLSLAFRLARFWPQIRALACLLESNPDMWPVLLDQCYSESYSVAVGYFQVLVEVYCLQGLACPTPQLLAVVLFMLVHERKV